MKYEVQKTTHYCRCFPADKNCAKKPSKVVYKCNYLRYNKTPEGGMRARMNDFIIRGIHGELYVCKPSIFYETYERVD